MKLDQLSVAMVIDIGRQVGVPASPARTQFARRYMHLFLAKPSIRALRGARFRLSGGHLARENTRWKSVVLR